MLKIYIFLNHNIILSSKNNLPRRDAHQFHFLSVNCSAVRINKIFASSPSLNSLTASHLSAYIIKNIYIGQ
jgi:hypothetical protein